MPSRLTWRNATKADKGELDVFCCTTPAEKPSVANGWQPRHPRKWEYEAQQYLRGRQIPGPQSPFFMRVGRTTDEELVGVAYYEEVDGPGFVYFHAAAIALPFQGDGYAAEMYDDAMDMMTARALLKGVREVQIRGLIFHQNEHSQKAAAKASADRTGEIYSTGAEEWGLTILVGEDA